MTETTQVHVCAECARIMPVDTKFRVCHNCARLYPEATGYIAMGAGYARYYCPACYEALYGRKESVR